MSYLRVKNFWDYQNADAWKKARENKGGHRHPAWCKLFVRRDMELEALSLTTRLVFYELLKLATTYENLILNDSEAISKAISVPRQQVSKAITELVKGRWLQETKTARRSREPSRKSLETFYTEQSREEKKEPALVGSSNVNVDGAADNNLEGLGRLNDERWFEVEKILLVTEGADSRSRQVVEACAHALPLNVLADIRERARGKSIGWAVSALKAEASDRQRGAA